MNRIFLLLLPVFILSSCSKQAELPLAEDLAFVHFQLPKVNAGSLSMRLDSLDFSFVYEKAAMKTKTLAIPLSLVGQKKSYNRELKVNIDKSETTIDLGWVDIEKPMIGAERFNDTLFVNITRVPSMKQKMYSLTLRIDENEHFSAGQIEKSRIKILVSDQFLEPYWWGNWVAYLGTFYPEVYREWIKIYKIGLDNSLPVNSDDKPNFAWNNMPSFPIQAQYPITFFYLSELKEYFEKNIIYPHNDSSLARIKLP